MRRLYDLRLTSKFALLGMISLLVLVLPVALYFQGVIRDGEHARNQNRARHAVLAINDVIRLMQSHRGLSAAELSGDAELAARRPAVQNDVVEKIQALDAEFEDIGISADLQGQWTDIKQGWNNIQNRLNRQVLSRAQSFDAHTQLIRDTLDANEHLLAEFGFSLDSSTDTYFLSQVALVLNPEISEVLGIMRAQGAGFLAQGEISRVQVASLDTQVSLVGQLQHDIRTSLSRAVDVNPAMYDALSGLALETRAQVDHAVGLINQQLIRASALQYPATRYFDEMTRTIEALYAFNAVAMDQLSDALALRVSDSNQRLLMTSLALLAGLFTALLMAIAIIRSIISPVNRAVQVAEAVAQGDLTVSVPVQGGNEFAALMGRMERMRQHLVMLVTQVTRSSEDVANASWEMAENSEDLSSRTVSQAAALEETAASMEELTVTVRHNADRAERANALSESATDVAGKSGAVVEQLAQTMGDVNNLSKQIVDIIDVIDGIAFQTNILALNASVEAARAGVQGRGFAVVATEVRALAQRSASAAHEIKDLIDTSVGAINQGYQLATEAGSLMGQTVASIRDVTEIMSEISLASQEQSIATEQVNQAVLQMDEVTQKNVSLVDQTTQASRSLKQQAADLTRLVASFKIHSALRPAIPVAEGLSEHADQAVLLQQNALLKLG